MINELKLSKSKIIKKFIREFMIYLIPNIFIGIVFTLITTPFDEWYLIVFEMVFFACFSSFLMGMFESISFVRYAKKRINVEKQKIAKLASKLVSINEKDKEKIAMLANGLIKDKLDVIRKDCNICEYYEKYQDYCLKGYRQVPDWANCCEFFKENSLFALTRHTRREIEKLKQMREAFDAN